MSRKSAVYVPWALAIVAGISFLVRAASQLPSEPDRLPEPYATRSARNSPRVVPKPQEAQLRVPPGFEVRVWAEGFERPRFMLTGGGGELLLADSGGEARSAAVGSRGRRGHTGAVYVFPEANPGKRRKLIDSLDRPYGLALWKDYLYVAEPESVKRYRYDASSAQAGQGQEVIAWHGFGDGHWTRSLLFDRAGDKLYAGIGSESNVSPGEDPRRAAISRYNPDGSGHEIYAAGLRNPIGLHWYPGTDDLWAAVQERDALGDDLVPDYFTQVRQGAFYGWPFAYIGPHPDPRLKGRQPDLAARTAKPDVLLGSHVAVMDFAFYTGRQFPSEYRGGAFLALHGSWNRSKRVGYSIAFVPFRNGRPSGPPRDFLTGWMLSPDRAEVWGRPVGVVQATDGSLLVSDDGGGRIWRIAYRGH
ncbi:MAG: PQQ-dependent sugar dehydrogenase [Bryobacterales bacterium]|nr:PQQ-dependent sugar dehydrogenase [Bryobacterales bacterium]